MIIYYGHLLNSFEFIKDAITHLKENGVEASANNISKVCNGKMKFAYGYVWRYNDDPFNKYNTPLIKRVEQRNLYSGELLNTFSTYVEAAKNTKSLECCIGSCCNGKTNQHNGYIWCFEGDYNDNILQKRKEKRVKKYNLNGEYLGIFNSITEASKSVNASNISGIADVCYGKHISSYGYIWRFENDDFDKYNVNFSKVSGNRKINQYTKEDIFIQTLENSTCAKELVNLKHTSLIISCCKHKLKSTHGYKWFYADDPEQPDRTKIIA